MLDGFKKFILRGNVVDMAVGVVIGAAFGGVVTALTNGPVDAFIAALVGKPDFSSLQSTFMGAVSRWATFVNASRVVPADCGGGLFLCCDSRECAGGADAEGSGAGGSDDQEVSGVLERDSDRCKAVRTLHTASDGESGLAALFDPGVPTGSNLRSKSKSPPSFRTNCEKKGGAPRSTVVIPASRKIGEKWRPKFLAAFRRHRVT